MSVDLLLKNGTVIVDGKETTRSLGVKAGKIEGFYVVGSEPDAHEITDCSGLYVLPGAIDIHVHLRDLGQSNKEDYMTGTRAAAAGGVTTVVDMPNSDPPVLTLRVLEEKITSAQEKRFVNVGFYAGVPKKAADFDASITPNILGVKEYPHSPLAQGTRTGRQRALDCMRICFELDLPLLFHPDSSKPGAASEDLNDFLALHSCDSEVKSIRQFLGVHSEIGGRLHVCHVSCESAARLIGEHRAEKSLTAEVTPHHLLLAGSDFIDSDGTAKVLPPLRTRQDCDWLRHALCGQCSIDCVVSDHAPHTEQEKLAPFLKAASGMSGLETLVPLMLTEVFDGRLSWVDYLRCCCSAPAWVLRIGNKGVLTKGYDADITVVQREETVIRGADFQSKAKITPFEGRRVLARPVMTVVGGELVYSYGKFMVGQGTAGRVPVKATR
jgi:dihydroorotase (multifunctional complex type)